MAQQKTGMGTAGMVLGIIAAASAILSLIPVIGWFFMVVMWICAILGIIFGIIAMVKGDKSKGLVAIICSAFAILFYWILVAIIFSALF